MHTEPNCCSLDAQSGELRKKTWNDVQMAEIAATLKTWMIEDVLPLWATHARVPGSGAVYECLHLDGSPDRNAVVRTRVPARQIYVYAHAAVLGWYDDGGIVALEIFDWLMKTAWAPDMRPGFVHHVRLDGQVVDARRDTYDHAFMLLAFGWLARATGEKRVFDALDATERFLASTLTNPDGSVREDDLDTLPRRQNPHMHLFEARMNLHMALGQAEALTKANRLLDVIERYFIDVGTGLLGEWFTADLALVDGSIGQVTEPGHMAEWTWLLRMHERLTGRPSGELADRMLHQALKTRDPATGFLIDEADRAGNAVKTTRRLWPQTELAKALLGQAETGRVGAADQAITALTALKRYYLDQAPRGCWLDQFDEQGTMVAKRIPASSLYHIFVAVAEANRILAD
jgi:mannose/cellobiose epimerase-like protein (N-acyl-D-glucosamine 2-epimerase family)